MDSLGAFIFDLDGVLVDTAKYHYQAWKRLASSLGFELSPADNERLKGLSRRDSLDIVLAIGGISPGEEERELLAERKNEWYREFLADMDASELLPGVRDFILRSRKLGLCTAVASASKNAPAILAATGIDPLFDAIIDGSMAALAKPAPDLFLLAAKSLGRSPEDCLVFEDAAAGVAAARAAGMSVVGVGSPSVLGAADLVIPGFSGIEPKELLDALGESRLVQDADVF